MSRGYELPETLRAQIVILKQRGDSWAEIGEFLHVNSHTARKVYLKWEETRCFSSTPRAGRPKSFDERGVRHLARHITSSQDTRRQALGEIKNALNLTVCPKTLRNVITKDMV
jgi:transposase